MCNIVWCICTHGMYCKCFGGEYMCLVYVHISIVCYVNLSVSYVSCPQRYVTCGLYVNLYIYVYIYIKMPIVHFCVVLSGCGYGMTGNMH